MIVYQKLCLGWRSKISTYSTGTDKKVGVSVLINIATSNHRSVAKIGFKLLEKHPDLDGLFAITGLVAVGALRAFEERGYRVPEDVAVIGFSNWMISSLITPQLSTVEQNGARIGKKVLQLFLKTQESDTMEPVTSYVQETVRTQLLIRASSKRKEI